MKSVLLSLILTLGACGTADLRPVRTPHVHLITDECGIQWYVLFDAQGNQVGPWILKSLVDE